MNNKAQFDELNVGGVAMGLIGGAIAIWYASLMSMGIIGRIFIGLVTAVVCYVMASSILNQ